jgi:biotin carboxyl carrier protein
MAELIDALSQVSGAIWKIHVVPGTSVSEDDILGIVEAMKMEIPILSPCDGVVDAVLGKEGDIVEEGQPVVSIRR